ncbi:VOC family protein [Virgibacillus kekensis]|uniref:VOC family protein n=1 Tax=Virgibacillus kekensis TaxID=202261 RepID=A0ABV9DK35_9BACI
MTKLFKRIDTVFLEVTDIEKSIEWYTDVLDLELRWFQKEGGYAAIEIGETPLTLVRASEVKPATHCQFNFFTNDIKAAHERLQENNVDVDEIVDYGDVLSFEFRDPDGNILGVCFFEE